MARISGSFDDVHAIGGVRRASRRERMHPAAATRIQLLLFGASWALVAYVALRLM